MYNKRMNEWNGKNTFRFRHRDVVGGQWTAFALLVLGYNADGVLGPRCEVAERVRRGAGSDCRQAAPVAAWNLAEFDHIALQRWTAAVVRRAPADLGRVRCPAEHAHWAAWSGWRLCSETAVTKVKIKLWLDFIFWIWTDLRLALATYFLACLLTFWRK